MNTGVTKNNHYLVIFYNFIFKLKDRLQKKRHESKNSNSCKNG